MNGTPEEFPEMLMALQLAGAYCALDGWEPFQQWVRGRRGLEEGEQLSRQFLAASAKAMDLIIRQVEIEFLAARLEQDLHPGELQFSHVAGFRGVRGNGYGALLPIGDGGTEGQGHDNGEGAGGTGEENVRILRGAHRLP